ncbi:MAG: hypothetical protein AAFO81_10930 [Pseudomonadota bacterium]
MSALRSALQEAIVLLTSHENAKIRLINAWVDGLDLLSVDEMPDGIRETFMAMRDRLTAHQPVNNEHPIVATIRKMSPMDAARCGQDIVQLYLQVVNADSPVQLRLVEGPDLDETDEEPSVVPDFLTRH